MYEAKQCTVCGDSYGRKGYGLGQWNRSTTCSRACASAKGRAIREWASLEQRFAEKVDVAQGLGPNGDCHEWTGHRIKWGYGSFRVGNSVKKAHRVAYEIHVAPIPHGMLVLHSCDNPACCNPNHLSLGTHIQNMAQMIERGRKRNRGEGLLPRVDCSQDPRAMPVAGAFV
jgi:hypothetical protein